MQTDTAEFTVEMRAVGSLPDNAEMERKAIAA